LIHSVIKMASFDELSRSNSKDSIPSVGSYISFDHIRFWVGNAKQASLYYCARFGFEPFAYKGLETGSRDIAAHAVKQNKIIFIFESPYNPTGLVTEELGRHQMKHGDGVKDVAFEVDDCATLYNKTIERGAISIKEPWTEIDEHGSVTYARVKTYGDTIHTFVERKHYKGFFLPGFSPVKNKDPLLKHLSDIKLKYIDHVAGGQPSNQLTAVGKTYEDNLSFRRFWSVDYQGVETENRTLNTMVFTNSDESIKLVLGEAKNKKGKSQEYIDYYGGAGVAHIALYSDNIVDDIKAMKERGTEFCFIPDTYYDALVERLKLSKVKVSESIEELRQLNILIDFDDNGYLLQIFAKPCQDRPTLFLEFIQRNNFNGFGAGNIKALFQAIEAEQNKRGNLI